MSLCYSLSGNRLGIVGSAALGNALRSNCTLTFLKYVMCTVLAIREYIISIVFIFCMRSIDFSHSQISPPHVLFQGPICMLTIMFSTLSCSLADNNLQDEGASHLAAAIEINTSITHLECVGFPK